MRLVTEHTDQLPRVILHRVHCQQNRLRTGQTANIYFNIFSHCTFSFSDLLCRLFAAQIGARNDKQHDNADDHGDFAGCRRTACDCRQLRVTSGPVLDKPGDLAGLLTNLNPGDVLFIDEIHRLSPIVEEYLYSAMEDYKIDIVLDKGPSARSIQIELAPFTLIGATTRSGLLTSPLRARFGIQCHLEYYDAPVLAGIVRRSARILDVSIDDDAAHEVALRSRGTPRIANALLRRVRDFAMVKGEGHIDLEITRIALAALNIDSRGLDQMDNKILGTIIEKFNGGPVGLNTVATAVGEEAGTIEEVYEPFLIKEGFLQRTPRGREATPLAYQHLGFTHPRDGEASLF